MLGIIGAMDSEVNGIIAELSDVTELSAAGLVFHKGSYQGHECVIVKAGVGKVNAAMCTQLMIDNFKVDAIVNSGVAGSLNPRLGIGDIVLGKIAIEHDINGCGLDYPQGMIPDMETNDSFDGIRFYASEELLEKARLAAEKALPKTHVHIGTVLTGDIFIASGSKKDKLSQRFEGDCCEMEGAAIAHVCNLNGVPFLIIRAISDSADDSAEMDYPSFEKLAAENSIKLSLELISMS